MGTVFIDLLKMRVSVCSLPILSIAFLVLLQVQQDEATFPITIGAAAAPILALTAPQVAAIAGLVALAKIKVAGVAGGVLLARHLNSARSSGRDYNQKLDGVMSIINEKASDLRAAKFLAAAQYGQLARDVAKCEHRYQCALDLEIIQTVF